MKSVAIIGSGISGLSSAYFLSDDFEVHIYERAKNLGGRIATYTLNHKFIDNGTHLITSTCNRTIELLKELNTLKYVEFIPLKAKVYDIEIYSKSFKPTDISFIKLFIKNVFNLEKVPLLYLLKFLKYAFSLNLRIGIFKMPFSMIFIQPIIKKPNIKIFTSYNINKNKLNDLTSIYDFVILAVSPKDLASFFDVKFKMNNINFITHVYEGAIHENNIFIALNKSFDFVFIKELFGNTYVEFIKGCGSIDIIETYKFLDIFGLKKPDFTFKKNVLDATYVVGSVKIKNKLPKKVFVTGGFKTYLPDTLEAAILSAFNTAKTIKYLCR